MANLGFCTSWAFSHHNQDKHWIEVNPVDLHITNLPDSLIGTRIAHISDLHYSRTVSANYLKKCIHKINDLNADLVVMTGDYITHDFSGRFTQKVIPLLSHIHSTYGTYACLGNHDYGTDGFINSDRTNNLASMLDNMKNNGINVLRNDHTVVEIQGKQLCIVGLGDTWAKDLDAERAFRNTHSDMPMIVLSHNPESAEHLKNHKFDAALCGHTHGLKFQLTRSLRWPIWKQNDYQAGLYYIEDRKIYVNKGLGRLGRPNPKTPTPEITVYNLK